MPTYKELIEKYSKKIDTGELPLPADPNDAFLAEVGPIEKQVAEIMGIASQAGISLSQAEKRYQEQRLVARDEKWSDKPLGFLNRIKEFFWPLPIPEAPRIRYTAAQVKDYFKYGVYKEDIPAIPGMIKAGIPRNVAEMAKLPFRAVIEAAELLPEEISGAPEAGFYPEPLKPKEWTAPAKKYLDRIDNYVNSRWPVDESINFEDTPLAALAFSVSSNLPNSAAALGLSILTANPWPGLLVLAAMEQTRSYEVQRRYGRSPAVAAAIGLASGGLEVVTEKIPFDFMMKGNIVAGAVSEGLQEKIAGLGQNFMDEYGRLTFEGIPPREAAQQAVKLASEQSDVDMLAGGILGLLLSGSVRIAGITAGEKGAGMPETTREAVEAQIAAEPTPVAPEVAPAEVAPTVSAPPAESPPIEVPPEQPPTPPEAPPAIEGEPTPERFAEFITPWIKEHRLIREEIELEKTEELGVRFGKVAALRQHLLEQGVEPEEAIERSTGMLRHQLTEYQRFPSLRKILPAGWERWAFNKIATDTSLMEGERITLNRNFGKFLDGYDLTITEAGNIEAFFGREMGKAARARVPLFARVIQNIAELGGMWQTALTSIEQSYLWRQGSPLAIAYPDIGGKFVVEYEKAYFSPEKANETLEMIKKSPNFGRLRRGGLEFTQFGRISIEPAEREEFMLGARMLGKIPIVGKGIRAAERGSVVGMDVLRYGVADKILTAYEADGSRMSREDIRNLCEIINDLSGRTTLGKGLNRIAPFLNMLFAPRFTSSRYVVPVKFAIGTPIAAAMGTKGPGNITLARTIAANIAIRMAIMALVKAAWPDKVEIEQDLRSTDGGKIKVGNQRFDIWSGFLQSAQLFVRLVTGEMKTQAGDIVPVDRSELLWRFFRMKEAPGWALVTDALVGENAIGEPFMSPPKGKVGEWMEEKDIPVWLRGLSKETFNRLILIIAQDTIEAYINEGNYPIAFLADWIGISTATYEPVAATKMTIRLNELAQQMAGVNWRGLSSNQKEDLMTTHEDELASLEANLRVERELYRGEEPYIEAPQSFQERKAISKRLMAAMPEMVRKELAKKEIMLSIGGISRGKSETPFNDKQQQKHEEISKDEISNALTDLFDNAKPFNDKLYSDMSQAEKVEAIRETIRDAKSKATQKTYEFYGK